MHTSTHTTTHTSTHTADKRSLLHSPDQEYLAQILGLHLSSGDGSPYWIERAASLGLRWPDDLESLQAFKQRFAFRNRADQQPYEEHLRKLPIERFIPQSVLRNAKWLWASETGGTTGIAKRGTWGDSYWQNILEFSDEFLDLHHVPRGKNWLFIGPTGPHTTGRLLISIVENRKGRIFCIDMDPRIVRIYLQENNMTGVERYIRHIWQQVEPILRYQDIGVLFCTASLLEMLPRYLGTSLLEKVQAVVHAGLAMSRDTHQYLREELFPGRPVVGIYGTSVSGISFQKPYEPEDNHRVIYIPSSPFIHIDVIDDRGNEVEYDREGNLRCFRFTRDQLIPGFIERDLAHRIHPFGKYAANYSWDWIADPHSPKEFSGQSMEGVY